MPSQRTHTTQSRKHARKAAHSALDAAVLAAYGFSAKADLLAQLLALNQTVAARIASGIPATYPTPATLITEDCIRPSQTV